MEISSQLPQVTMSVIADGQKVPPLGQDGGVSRAQLELAFPRGDQIASGYNHQTSTTFPSPDCCGVHIYGNTDRQSSPASIARSDIEMCLEMGD